ncbi:MAG: PfkB family carbohydrate kinase [Acidimicrobiales bacterium]
MGVPDGDYRRKIKTAAQLAALVGERPRQRTVVMCHGTFDLVHPGHVLHLIYAKSKGAVLVASLTADEHILKADHRPYIPQDLRAMNLAALEVVDYVVVDGRPTPVENIEIIQPDIFVKGYEYVGGLHPETAREQHAVEAYGGEMIFTPGDTVYSSSAIIETAPPELAIEKLVMLLAAEGLGFDDLRRTLESLRGTAVHVVGDTIVDTLTETSLIGAAGKTPTFSVRFEGRHDFVGGAGVVARHLAAAGARATLSTVLGDDALKDFVADELTAAGVELNALVDPTRPTPNKNAFVANGYRLLKVDTLDNRSLSDERVAQLQELIGTTPAEAVVFSDFRHGIFNRSTITRLIAAIPEGAFRAADSQVASRWGNILDFQNFDLITPNEQEARFALGDQDTTIRPLGSELYEQAKCRTLMLTTGSRGLMCFRRPMSGQDHRTFFSLDSFASRVIDPVGAGDALLAYSSLALRASGNPVIASVLGGFAAAVECEHDGNVPVTLDAVGDKLDSAGRRADFGP